MSAPLNYYADIVMMERSEPKRCERNTKTSQHFTQAKTRECINERSLNRLQLRAYTYNENIKTTSFQQQPTHLQIYVAENTLVFCSSAQIHALIRSLSITHSFFTLFAILVAIFFPSIRCKCIRCLFVRFKLLWYSESAS